MSYHIDKDHERFRRIVKGELRKNLRRFLSRTDIIGKKGKDIVRIPIPRIDIPRFRYDRGKAGGLGQGEGEEGDIIGQQPGEGREQAGKDPGIDIYEVDLTIEELAEILSEELELPKIEPKGQKHIYKEHEKYVGISRTGPESLRHFKRTFRKALKRQIISGDYDPNNPTIIPIKDDKRYRSWKLKEFPEAAAVIFYILDVSGSMYGTLDTVRAINFWIDIWLRANYKGIDVRYIKHDAVAEETDREHFYKRSASGGTKFEPAYALCEKIIKDEYNPEQFNIYIFHFSDGDNWGADDTKQAKEIMKRLLPQINLFCYGQVSSEWGSGNFLKNLEEVVKSYDNLITAEIESEEDIYSTIKKFLGKGK